MTTLSDLRSRVLAGSGEDARLEYDLHQAFNPTTGTRLLSDLNAVIALARERLPALRPMIWMSRVEPQEWAAHFIDAGDTQYASSPARALLAALLGHWRSPMSTLSERLRDHILDDVFEEKGKYVFNVTTYDHIERLGDEAADELDRLTAELKAARSILSLLTEKGDG